MQGHGDCLGVDGAKAGWVAVWRVGGGLAYRVYPSAQALFDAHADAGVIAVDIPIGLPPSGRRAADVEARRFVGGRRASSIFSSPVRGVLHAASQPEASRLHRDIDGRGFGAQSFALLPKVRAWDALLQADPRARGRVREMHPEVAFAALAGGAGHGLVAGKKTAEGHARRIALLAPLFGEDAVRALLQAVPRAQAAPDDVLDATVALHVAERIAAGEAATLPAPPERDGTGLPMAIWY